MKFRSMGLTSDILIMRGQSEFEHHANRTIMRTPKEPDYWQGNLVIMHECGDPVSDVGHFATDFPDASHLTVVWDVPGLDPAPIRAALPHLEVDTFDVLSLANVIQNVPAPPGIELKPLTVWDRLLDLQLEIAAEEGYDLAAHKGYLQRRNAAFRAQIADHHGQWFGAFEGELLVGTMGIFHDTHIARYQSVMTRASHRRRGICAALLAYVCLWVQDRAPNATPLIVAQSNSDAGRLYRRMGFVLSETLVEATKRGY